MDGHSAPSDMLLISTHTLNKLTDEQKMWLQKAVDISLEYQKKLWEEAEIEFMEIMQKGGMTVVYPDTSQFKQAVIPFYEKLKVENPMLYQMVQEIKKMPVD